MPQMVFIPMWNEWVNDSSFGLDWNLTAMPNADFKRCNAWLLTAKKWVSSIDFDRRPYNRSALRIVMPVMALPVIRTYHHISHHMEKTETGDSGNSNEFDSELRSDGCGVKLQRQRKLVTIWKDDGSGPPFIRVLWLLSTSTLWNIQTCRPSLAASAGPNSWSFGQQGILSVSFTWRMVRAHVRCRTSVSDRLPVVCL